MELKKEDKTKWKPKIQIQNFKTWFREIAVKQDIFHNEKKRKKYKMIRGKI